MAEAPIAVGQQAPAFTLPDQDGNPVSLDDLQGRWVVLYFYPKDDTPGCTTQACDFTAGLKDFETLNATVLGCSPDDGDSHRKFISKHDLHITLLSDTAHSVMEQYGAWGKKNMYGKISEGVIRSTVIIDPQGQLAHHWKRAKAAGHAEQVRKKLTELQAG